MMVLKLLFRIIIDFCFNSKTRVKILTMRTLVNDIVQKEGQEVELMGWVAVRRDHGKLIFIDLRDRTGLAQIVFTKELYKEADQLRPEWVVKITGQVKARPANM